MFQTASVKVTAYAAIVDFTAYVMPKYIILRLFSGRRRHNDIQAQLEYGAAFSTYELIVISLDIAVDETFGDLSNNAIVTHWAICCRSGIVAGFVAGPPCENWIAVRHNLLEDKHSPPPLRSGTHPWGLDSLEYKHYQQLAIGSKLLQVVLYFFTILLKSGGFALAEHPSPSKTVQQASSIWKLSYTQWLQVSPAIVAHHFNQGPHGQVSTKPTTFLCLRLPTIDRYLHKYQGGEKKQKAGILQGTDTTGAFRTKDAKEYPESLNRAISNAIIDSL